MLFLCDVTVEGMAAINNLVEMGLAVNIPSIDASRDLYIERSPNDKSSIVISTLREETTSRLAWWQLKTLYLTNATNSMYDIDFQDVQATNAIQFKVLKAASSAAARYGFAFKVSYFCWTRRASSTAHSRLPFM